MTNRITVAVLVASAAAAVTLAAAPARSVTLGLRDRVVHEENRSTAIRNAMAGAAARRGGAVLASR